MSEILIVDDEPGIRDLLQEILEDEGYEVRLAENGEQARAARQEKAPDLVLLDIWMPDVDGLSLLREWSANGQLTMPVVMMSGHGTIHTAIEATRLGASDFLEKPVPYKKLLLTVEKALSSRPAPVAAPISLDWLGRGEVVRQLAQRLRQAVGSGVLLLTGEAGVGVEACARYLHNANQAWLAPDDMAALAERPLDWLTQARDGVLFLREVGKLTPLQQKGLLLLLGRRPEFGVSVICATTENLATAVAESGYSRDLYNALVQAAVRIPPLREHREDISDLATAALREALVEQQLPARRFSVAALDRLARHDWPGNLEELQSVVRNLACNSLDGVIDRDAVDALLGNAAQADGSLLGGLFALPLKDARDAFEKAYLEAILAECGGSMTRVAERSGLERTHLYRKLKQLGVKSAGRNESA